MTYDLIIDHERGQTILSTVTTKQTTLPYMSNLRTFIAFPSISFFLNNLSAHTAQSHQNKVAHK